MGTDGQSHTAHRALSGGQAGATRAGTCEAGRRRPHTSGKFSGKVDSGVLAAAGRGSRVGYRESLPKLENLERQLWTQAHKKQRADELGSCLGLGDTRTLMRTPPFSCVLKGSTGPVSQAENVEKGLRADHSESSRRTREQKAAVSPGHPHG